jgi:hypothetical protein
MEELDNIPMLIIGANRVGLCVTLVYPRALNVLHALIANSGF